MAGKNYCALNNFGKLGCWNNSFSNNYIQAPEGFQKDVMDMCIGRL